MKLIKIFGDDPFVDKKCPNCGTVNPETYVDGVGEGSIKCSKCNVFRFTIRIKNGYTMIFDDLRSFGITVDKDMAYEIAENAKLLEFLPAYSRQYSCNILARSDFEPVASRVIPMIGISEHVQL